MVVFYYMYVYCKDDFNSMNWVWGVGIIIMNYDYKMMIIYYIISILMLNLSLCFIILYEFSL